MIPDRPLSSLIGKTARKIACGPSDHPLLAHMFIELSLYELTDGVVLCLSEGERPYDLELAKSGLGRELPGALLIPFAQRFFEILPGGNIKDVAKILEESVKNLQLHWEQKGETKP